MYCGQLGKHGLSLSWKLGLDPSIFAHLSTISSCLPKWLIVGPELGIGGKAIKVVGKTNWNLFPGFPLGWVSQDDVECGALTKICSGGVVFANFVALFLVL
jgi:hypothetical protein